jgi:hypothetical protein
MGANVGATRANDLPRQADDSGQAADNLASSRTDPDDAERDTGNYGSEGWGFHGPRATVSDHSMARHQRRAQAPRVSGNRRSPVPRVSARRSRGPLP